MPVYLFTGLFESGKTTLIYEVAEGDRFLEPGETLLNARYCESADSSQKCFVPGRHAMICCEDDIQFLGFRCFSEGKFDFKHGDWISLDVKYYYGSCDMYGPEEDGPILYLQNITAGEKTEQELVTFT